MTRAQRRVHCSEYHLFRFQVDDWPTFRESFSTHGTEDTSVVRQIYATCRIAHEWRCHVVADGYFYRCPPSYFLPKGSPHVGFSPQADALEISSGPSFKAQLLAYLESPEPLRSCRFCLGTAGARFAHHEAPRKGWADQQAVATEGLLDPLFAAGTHSTRDPG